MAGKMTAEPGVAVATLRGVTYTLREISIGEYDECVQKATDTKTNALGEDVEVTDRGRLLRLMVIKSAGISAADLSALKMPVVLKLNQLVNDMHYLDEKTDEEKKVEADAKKKADKKAGADGDDEGDSSGNAG